VLTLTAIYAPFAPQNLGAASTTQSSFDLSWLDSTDNGGSPITGHEIIRKHKGTVESVLQVDGANVQKHTVSNLNAGETYIFTVKAKNAYGTSAESGEITVKMNNGAPGAPRTLRKSDDAEITHNSAKITWEDNYTGGSPITSYEIEWRADGQTQSQSATYTPGRSLNAGSGATAHSYMMTGLTENTKYFVTVSAKNAFGTGGKSNALVVQTVSAPDEGDGEDGTTVAIIIIVLILVLAITVGAIITYVVVTDKQKA
jgi:hypothetical protein